MLPVSGGGACVGCFFLGLGLDIGIVVFVCCSLFDVIWLLVLVLGWCWAGAGAGASAGAGAGAGAGGLYNQYLSLCL